MQVDLLTIIAGVIGIAVVVVAVRYFRTHPDAKAAVEHEASAAWDKLVDLAHRQHDTIAAQSNVIASPPVQAAINAQPAAPAVSPLAPIPGAPVEPTIGSGITSKDGYPYVEFGGQMVYQYDGRNFLTLDDLERYRTAVAARADQQKIIDTFHPFGPNPR